MDMVLYSLIQKEIKDFPKDRFVKVGGYEIRFVSEIPKVREENTIYFVMGEGQSEDNIYIGKQGIVNIVFNDYMIDYGILNGNVFLDRYDLLRKIIRTDFTNDTGYLDCRTTPYGEKVDKLIITGATKGESIVSNVKFYGKTLDTTENEEAIITSVNKTMYGLPNGEGDSFNVLTGEYTQETIVDVIDARVTWSNVALYGDYREFSIDGYLGFVKPAYLTYSGFFNSNEVEVFTKENAYSNSGFEIISASDNRDNKACVFVSRSTIKVRVLNSELDTSSTTLAKAMQKYIAEHPITIVMTRKVPIVEKIAEPQELKTYNGYTKIRIEFEGDAPIITAKVPILKED